MGQHINYKNRIEIVVDLEFIPFLKLFCNRLMAKSVFTYQTYKDKLEVIRNKI